MIDEVYVRPLLFTQLICETKIISKEKFSKGSLKETVAIPNIIPVSFRAFSKFLNMNSLFSGLKVR